MIIGINLLFLVAGKGGGIERYARSLVAALQRIDDENQYIIFTNSDCRGSFNLTANFREVASRVSARFRPSKILWEQAGLPCLLRYHKIDVLLSPGNIAPLLTNCPSAVIIHDLIPFFRPELFSITERIALQTLMDLTAKRCSRIITVSESTAKSLIRSLHVRSEKISVVPGACSETFKPVPATPERTEILRKYEIRSPYILYVASTRPYKNVDGLIKAFEVYQRKRGTDHSLVITGLAGKAQPELVGLVHERGLATKTIFPGFVSDDDLAALYSAADLSVYPSFYEGFGLPLLESMACGTPVAASNLTSLPEVLGNAGVLFNPDNIEQMADAMSRIISDRELRVDLIKKGFARVKMYSWDSTATSILTVLKNLV